MGHRDKLKSGDEWDLVAWRLVLSKRAGVWRWIKKRINRRARRAIKRECKKAKEDQQCRGESQ